MTICVNIKEISILLLYCQFVYRLLVTVFYISTCIFNDSCGFIFLIFFHIFSLTKLTIFFIFLFFLYFRFGSSSSQTSQTSGDICRICHCESDPQNPLLTPCYCSGSLKYVHQACLQQWLTASETNSCELCKFPFIMHTKIKPFNEVGVIYASLFLFYVKY